MGKVKAFKINGLYLFFNSNDHRLAHFHAKKSGAWEIRVYILTCKEKHLHFDLKWPKNNQVGPTATEQKQILLLVLKHREELLKEWEAKVFIKEMI